MSCQHRPLSYQHRPIRCPQRPMSCPHRPIRCPHRPMSCLRMEPTASHEAQAKAQRCFSRARKGTNLQAAGWAQRFKFKHIENCPTNHCIPTKSDGETVPLWKGRTTLPPSSWGSFTSTESLIPQKNWVGPGQAIPKCKREEMQPFFPESQSHKQRKRDKH